MTCEGDIDSGQIKGRWEGCDRGGVLPVKGISSGQTKGRQWRGGYLRWRYPHWTD